MQLRWGRLWLIVVLIILTMTIVPNVLLAIKLIEVTDILSLYSVVKVEGYLMNMTTHFLALYPTDDYLKIIGITFLAMDYKNYFLLISFLFAFVVNNRKIKFILGSYFLLLFLTILIVVTQGIVLFNTMNILEVLMIANWLGYLVLSANVVVVLLIIFWLVKEIRNQAVHLD